LADATPNVHFVGRLATYKYYNMDQVVAQALMTFASLTAHQRVGVTPAIIEHAPVVTSAVDIAAVADRALEKNGLHS
jgi:UDP-galactopyranose mutase